MTDEPITSVQVHCTQCVRTTRAQGDVTPAMVAAIAERHQEETGHEVEILIPAPTYSLAARYETHSGTATINGRW